MDEKTYSLRIDVTFSGDIEIKAKNKKEAERIARDKYYLPCDIHNFSHIKTSIVRQEERMERDKTLFGQKIKNLKTNELGLIINTWTNKFADGEIEFATCVDTKGKKYNIEIDNLELMEV